MKRKTLKRKISIVGILVFVSMIVYSCWQDEWSSNVTDEVIFDSNKELTIAKAEQWYNATNPSATTVRSLSADGRIPAKPNWNKAKESKKGDLEVVETTLMTSGSTFFMDNETKEKYELQDDLDKIYNVARMVTLKNLETGEIYNFIMVFIGTYDYLMHTTSFENNSYLHREADFDGKVLFYNFNYGLVPFPPYRLYDYFMGRFKGFSYTIPTGICEIREFYLWNCFNVWMSEYHDNFSGRFQCFCY